MNHCAKCGKAIDSSGPGATCPECVPVPVTVGAAPDDPDRTHGSAPPPAAASTPSFQFSPDFLARYEMLDRLGAGAMGAVYLMRQRDLDRRVAVKVVREDALDPLLRERLLKEAQILARVNHPHVVTVHAVGVDGAAPYMVCEFVEGPSLAARLQKSPALAPAEALSILVQMLEGLEAIHQAGVVHRDIKPANVVLTREGRVKLVDFGLARAKEVAGGTLSGRILGTPPYMCPEQCTASPVTPASDLYSAGILLVELLTGRPPFTGPTVADYLRQHVTEPVPPITSLAPELTRVIQPLVMRALAKKPDDRFQSAREMRDALAPAIALAAKVTGVAALSAPPPAARIALPVGALLLLLALIAAMSPATQGPASPPVSSLAPAAPIAATPIAITRRIALVIGISRFQAGTFNAPGSAASARAFGALLAGTRAGSHTTTLLIDEQATAAAMIAAWDTLADLGPGDGVFVFFAGHLQPWGAETYLIPYDLPAPAPDAPLESVLRGAPRLRDLLEAVFDCRAGERTVVLDAQASGRGVDLAAERYPAAEAAIVSAATLATPLPTAACDPRLAILAATTTEGQAFGGDASLFTTVLLEGLKGRADALPPAAWGDGNGAVTATELARYAARLVPLKLGRGNPEYRQEPVAWIACDLRISTIDRSQTR